MSFWTLAVLIFSDLLSYDRVVVFVVVSEFVLAKENGAAAIELVAKIIVTDKIANRFILSFPFFSL